MVSANRDVRDRQWHCRARRSNSLRWPPFLVFSRLRANAPAHGGADETARGVCFTHDSIGLGEDGPTHQPVEHASTLRLIPNMDVWRPCDTTETAIAWTAALERRDGPSSLLLSRQNLPFQNRDQATTKAIARGGYVLFDAAGANRQSSSSQPRGDCTGVAAREKFAAAGLRVRVVSMPSHQRLRRQARRIASLCVLPRGAAATAIGGL